MSKLRLPLVLLAGRDRRPAARLPEEGRDQHRLSGYKAMEIVAAGQPLIVHLLARLDDCGAFDPIFVAGPAHVYASLEGDVRLVDTDADFGDNLRAGVEAAMASGAEGQVAVMTSDVLPDPAELAAAIEDLERHWPLDFWWLQCRVRDREQLGTSAWKPEYLILPEGESEPAATVPGHLVVADPQALRLDLIYYVFELLYRTRNQPIVTRRAKVVRGVLLKLLAEDARRLFTLRRPGITWDLLHHCLAVARKLVSGGCSQREIEDRLRRAWVRWDHRRRYPERRGRLWISDGLSLGRDLDTEEEAREVLRELEAGST